MQPRGSTPTRLHVARRRPFRKGRHALVSSASPAQDECLRVAARFPTGPLEFGHIGFGLRIANAEVAEKAPALGERVRILFQPPVSVSAPSPCQCPRRAPPAIACGSPRPPSIRPFPASFYGQARVPGRSWRRQTPQAGKGPLQRPVSFSRAYCSPNCLRGVQCVGVAALEVFKHGLAALRVIDDDKAPRLAQADRRRKASQFYQALQGAWRQSLGGRNRRHHDARPEARPAGAGMRCQKSS